MVTLNEARQTIRTGIYTKAEDLLVLEDKTIRQIRKAYEEARDEVARELQQRLKVYKPGLDQLTDARLKLAQTKILRDAKLYENLEARIAQLGGKVDKITAQAILEANGVSNDWVMKEFNAICRFTNLDPSSFALINHLQAEAAINNVNQGTKFISEAIKKDTLSAMRQQMRIGILKGESIDKITQRLVSKTPLTLEGVNKGVFSSVEARARLNARWGIIESSNAAAVAQYESFNARVDAADHKDLKVMKQAIAHIDDRTTVTCIYANGQIQPLEKPFETDQGYIDYAPFHPNCRTAVSSWHEAFEAYGRKTDDMIKQSKKEMAKRDKKWDPTGKTKKQLKARKAQVKAGKKATKATAKTAPKAAEEMTAALAKKAQDLTPEQLHEVLSLKTNKARSRLINKFNKANANPDFTKMSEKEFFEYWTKEGRLDKFVNAKKAGEWGDASGDQALKEIWKQVGYDKKPTIVSKAEFNGMVENNNNFCMWRGIGGKDGQKYAAQFIDGDYYPGLGVYGNGTYAANGNIGAMRTAMDYAGFGEGAGQYVKPSDTQAVIRFLVNKDAKVVNLVDLNDERQQILRTISEGIEKRRIAGLKANEGADFWNAIAKEEDLFRDFQDIIFDDGRFASMRGYDVISAYDKTIDTTDGAYFVIQNRSKVTMADEILNRVSIAEYDPLG